MLIRGFILISKSKGNFVPKIFILVFFLHMSCAISQGSAESPKIEHDSARAYSGFKLNIVSEDSAYLKMGLMKGDVVKEVNGEELRDVQHAIKVLNSLRADDNMVITVVRNGKSKIMEIKARTND